MRPWLVRQRRALLGSSLALVFGVIAYGWSKPPLPDSYSYSGAIYDRNGELLRLILAADDQYRLRVERREIPASAIEATLMYEDRYFRWHPGFNPVALVRAAYDTYLLGKSPRGASTITMQLARMHFRINSRSISGKLEQILRAVQLELHYTKDEILTAYFNLAPYGGNLQGIAAASLIYFAKRPMHLSLPEAQALALIPQDPNTRSQAEDGHECAELFAMRKHLAALWLQARPGANDHELAIRFPLKMAQRNDLPFRAPHFVTSLVKGGDARGILRATLDLQLQALLERRVDEYLELRREHDISNLAVMLLDHRDMETLAVLGSANFHNARIDGQVDGTKAKRSPGSTLKPFIYALALQQGLIHPRSLMKDAPMRFDAYNPENFDGQFVGPMPATEALVRSRNVPAVFLETRLANGGLHGFLKEVGVPGLRDRDHYGLAIVLGGLEVSMEQLVELYAMLANQGRLRPIRRLAAEPIAKGRQVLNRQASTLALDMLRENPRPGQAFHNDWIAASDDVAWKTGTSYGYRDAWSVGVVGPFVLAVWVGNFDGRGNPEFLGRKAAAPLFFHLVDALRPYTSSESSASYAPLENAAGIEEVKVCSVSGQLPGRHCPRMTTTGFIPGVSPIETCEIHRNVFINRINGLRACDPQSEVVDEEVFEFWPSDLSRLFERAGVPRKRPPPYPETCDLERRVLAGMSPQITSPQPDVVYTIRSREMVKKNLPLTATADADVRELHWFVNEDYLGKTSHQRPLLWELQPGDYVVRVVDDAGRANAQNIQVALVD